MAKYTGDVVFREGVHYPIKDDKIDLARPLRRNASNDGWRDAEDGEALHNETHSSNERDLLSGGDS